MTTRRKKPPAQRATPAQRRRQQEAIDLRIQGHTYHDIAKQLGYKDRASAYNAIHALLDRTEHDHADQLRELEQLRLDHLWHRALTDLAKADHDRSSPLINTCVRISERRSRLLGLDAPTRIHDVTPPPVDFAARERQLTEEILALRDTTA